MMSRDIKIPQMLKLYTKSWRAGGNKVETGMIGKGGTLLLNDEGYMCCLGQWSLQCGVPPSYLIEQGEPMDIDPSYRPSFEGNFVKKAISINDEENINKETRITKLKNLTNEYGYSLEVIESEIPVDVVGI